MIRRVLLICLSLGAIAPLAAAPKAFFAVNVRNAETAAAWYARMFQLEEIKRFDEPGFVVRVLGRGEVVIELVQLRPEPPAAPEPRLGMFKVGFVIEDFDATIARWREGGVRFFGDGAPRIFFERSLGLHNTLLFDPEGNLLQVFGLSATAPR